MTACHLSTSCQSTAVSQSVLHGVLHLQAIIEKESNVSIYNFSAQFSKLCKIFKSVQGLGAGHIDDRLEAGGCHHPRRLPAVHHAGHHPGEDQVRAARAQGSHCSDMYVPSMCHICKLRNTPLLYCSYGQSDQHPAVVNLLGLGLIFRDKQTVGVISKAALSTMTADAAPHAPVCLVLLCMRPCMKGVPLLKEVDSFCTAAADGWAVAGEADQPHDQWREGLHHALRRWRVLPVTVTPAPAVARLTERSGG